MKLKLVKAANEYCNQIRDMLDEWNASGEKIIPYAIRRLDYHDFECYCNNLEVKDTSKGLVPDSTFFLFRRRSKHCCRCCKYSTLFERSIIIKRWSHRRWYSSV